MTVRTISWSEIDSWRQCPFKWRLEYAERWVPAETSPALSKGTLWHTVLEKHYRILQSSRSLATAMDAVDAFLDAMTTDTSVYGSATPEYVDLIRWMYSGYVQMWQHDDAEHQIIEIELRRELPLIEGIVNIKCKIDYLMKDLFGFYWLYDHKSGQNLPSKRETDLDDQFALYQWILNQTLDANIFGIVHNAARTTRLKTREAPLVERFARIKMVRTEVEMQTMIEEIQSTALDIVAAYDNLDSPETLVTPRHPDPDRCKWRCSFTNPCLLGRGTEPSRTRTMLKDLDFTQDWTRH